MSSTTERYYQAFRAGMTDQAIADEFGVLLTTVKTYRSTMRHRINRGLEPISRDMLIDALFACKQLFDEALPQFNWGSSALDANAIKLLNDVPLQVNRIVAVLPEQRAG